MRIGFVGCGAIAEVHMANLATFDGVELVAFCDTLYTRANAAVEKYGGTAYYDNYAEMYRKERLDAIYICVPPSVHGPHEIYACELGIHFFREKPVGISLLAAREIDDCVLRNGIITSVGYQWRYREDVISWKHYLENKTIIGALGYIMSRMPKNPPTWWYNRYESGGQHVEQSTHMFDLLRYLIGEVVSVHGFAVPNPVHDIDDMSVINLLFDNGASANVATGCILDEKTRHNVEIFLRGESCRISTADSPLADLIRRADHAFITSVKDGNSSHILVPYGDAVKTLEIALAASDSFKTGETHEIMRRA